MPSLNYFSLNVTMTHYIALFHFTSDRDFPMVYASWFENPRWLFFLLKNHSNFCDRYVPTCNLWLRRSTSKSRTVYSLVIIIFIVRHSSRGVFMRAPTKICNYVAPSYNYAMSHVLHILIYLHWSPIHCWAEEHIMNAVNNLQLLRTQ